MTKTGTGSGAGMDQASIRKHITLARKQAVHVAFALGSDGKAIVLMDRRRQPRTMAKDLQEGAADAKACRFGTLAIPPDQPTLARLVVNKAAPGMARKLVVAMKGTGVRQVEIVAEDGTAPDSAQDEDGPAAGAAPHGTHDAEAAVERYRKSRAVWLKTREKVDGDIRALRARIMRVDHGGAFGDDLEEQFLSVVDPILDTLDGSLSHILEKAERAGTPDATDRLLGAARARVEAYRQFVSGNATIKGLDSNPFMPMAIGKTLDASLTALEAALR